MFDIYKSIIRYILIGVFGTIALSFAIPAWIERTFFSRCHLFYHFGSHGVACVPGLPGNFVRAAFYMICLDYFHPTAIVCFGSYFSKRNSRMEEHSGMGSYCIIGKVNIGKGTRIASRVSLVSGLNGHGSTSSMGKIEDAGEAREIDIGDNVWIGEGAVVAADVGDNSIVAAGSVVFNEVPEKSFAMGNPARLLPTKSKE